MTHRAAVWRRIKTLFVKPVTFDIRVLRRAWRRVTAWAEYATCPSSVVVAPDPDVDFKYLIYGLVDPRTRLIRYVGLSTTGGERPVEHRDLPKSAAHRYSARWVAELARCGLTYEIVVLEALDENWEALCAAEVWWIAYGRASGWPLTNLTAGGDGVRGLVKSDECRERMSETTRALWEDPTYRDKVTSALKDYGMGPALAEHHRCRREDVEYREKLSEKFSERNHQLVVEGRHPMQQRESRDKHKQAMKIVARTRVKRNTRKALWNAIFTAEFLLYVSKMP